MTNMKICFWERGGMKKDQSQNKDDVFFAFVLFLMKNYVK